MHQLRAPIFCIYFTLCTVGCTQTTRNIQCQCYLDFNNCHPEWKYHSCDGSAQWWYLCGACSWIVLFACEHTQSLVQHSLHHVQGVELLNLACIPKKKAGSWFARILAGVCPPGLLHKGRWWSATDMRLCLCMAMESKTVIFQTRRLFHSTPGNPSLWFQGERGYCISVR